MKKLSVLFLFVLVAAACGRTPEPAKTAPVQASLYQCPMKCEGEKTYEKAGTCPVCGMDLKPVEAVTPAVPDSSSHVGDSVRAV